MTDRFSRYFLIAVAAIIGLWIASQSLRDILLVSDEPRAVTARGSLAEFERLTVEIFDQISPSVVYIFTESAQSRALGRAGRGQGGAGSGFIWDASGHVVTNHHVIEGAARVAVRLDSGEAIAARVVGSAPEFDLAVLKLSVPTVALPPIPIGTSADLLVGQWVLAIGNPFGLSRTLTTGVISALDRTLPTARRREITGVIQTDAAINPGNSGGPLLDSAGRLIGVNTAIISGTGSSAGIGFAVPVDTVNRVVPELIGRGRVPQPGIGIVALDEEIAARMGIKGVAISEVLPGSAAQIAGLEAVDRARGTLGDVITQVGGRAVNSVTDLANALVEIGVGNEVELTVTRGNQSRVVSVTVMDIS